MMQNDLKPCPFCSQEAAIEQVGSFANTEGCAWSVGCVNEQCLGFQSVTTFARKTEAIEAWNQRTASTTDGTDLVELIRQRDDLNVRIKLMEDGIRKAKYDAFMLEQHLTINEARKAKGLRQISKTEFHAGIIYD